MLVFVIIAWLGPVSDAGAGALERLAGYGVDLQLYLNQTSGWVARGSDPGHSASYDLFGLVDLEQALDWAHFDALVHAKGQYDRSVNDDVAALSDPVDDADFDSAIYVDELWLQRSFLDGRALLRVGFLEQQTVFDRNAFANSEDRQFLSTFLDNNAVVPLPNGLGAVLLIKPDDRLEIALGVADADNEPRSVGFDTAFDGISSLTAYAEAQLTYELPGRETRSGTLRVGVFVDGRKQVILGSERADRGHVGAYLSADQRLWVEPGRAAQGLGAFARFGYADPDTNRIGWFWSVGFEYVGLLPGRDRDVTGLGVYQAIASDRYRDTTDSRFRGETGIEFYHCIGLGERFAITPDLQYVVDPGGFRRGPQSNRDAVIALLRIRWAF